MIAGRGFKPDMKIITINIPKAYWKLIRKYLEWGICPSVSEYVRRAIDRQIKDDMRSQRYVQKVIIAVDKDTILIPGYNGDKPMRILREA